MIVLLSTIVAPVIVGMILALFKQWLENRRK
ncbi:type I toxin-antitoxin system Fst family toxin [Enterococcus sp. LJL99]